jgi:hypothetical protein
VVGSTSGFFHFGEVFSSEGVAGFFHFGAPAVSSLETGFVVVVVVSFFSHN